MARLFTIFASTLPVELSELNNPTVAAIRTCRHMPLGIGANHSLTNFKILFFTFPHAGFSVCSIARYQRSVVLPFRPNCQHVTVPMSGALIIPHGMTCVLEVRRSNTVDLSPTLSFCVGDLCGFSHTSQGKWQIQKSTCAAFRSSMVHMFLEAPCYWCRNLLCQCPFFSMPNYDQS